MPTSGRVEFLRGDHLEMGIQIWCQVADGSAGVSITVHNNGEAGGVNRVTAFKSGSLLCSSVKPLIWFSFASAVGQVTTTAFIFKLSQKGYN